MSLRTSRWNSSSNSTLGRQLLDALLSPTLGWGYMGNVNLIQIDENEITSTPCKPRRTTGNYQRTRVVR